MRSTFDRVLVTGGAGFIGSHTVDALLDTNTHTWVADNFSSGSRTNLREHMAERQLHIARIDVRSFRSVDKLAKKVDAIIHLAAIVSPYVSIHNPSVTNEVNVSGTLNVLKAALRNDVKRIVFASSSSVYGEAEEAKKIDEDAQTNPITPYGVSKLSGEKYCSAFCTTFGTSTVSLRYFNVYGQRQQHNPYSGVIAIFADALLKGHRATIFGDGKQTRDFVYVKDVARANIDALNLRKANGQAFNVGSGVSTSINQLYDMIADIMNNRQNPKRRPPRRGDIRNSCANIGRAKRDLGFKSQTSLKDGLKALLQSTRSSAQSGA